MVAATGAEVAAYAMKQINPDVVAVYPITPQTSIAQNFSNYVSNGEVVTELVRVESEHSAMSATIGASAAGSRAMTATASNGLALMHEVVYIAASSRLPIVMPVVNRALSGPINIHCDHSDSMGERDSGWLQVYCENAQEVYDSIFVALKVAENKNVRLPFMVCQDGFITSHSLENVEYISNTAITKYIGKHTNDFALLDTKNPVTFGPLDLRDYYFEHKYQQAEAIKNSVSVIKEAADEFEKISGRKFEFIENYKATDAEVVILCMSSTAGTAKDVVDRMRKEGKKVGLLKLRVFRPFPTKELIKFAKKVKAMAILDRSDSFGARGGPIYSEVRSAFFDQENKPLLQNYIYGLGGRDIKPKDIEGMYGELFKTMKAGKAPKEDVMYWGVRK